jgi:hypothetical protein
MIMAITEGFRRLKEEGGDPHQLTRQLIGFRFIEALEKMAEDPATKVMLPSDMLQLLKQMGIESTGPGEDSLVISTTGTP